MKPTLENIAQLLSIKAQQQYGGEAVSQLQHALQCATLAQKNGATDELIIACLLHDIGHLLPHQEEDTIDNRHEYGGANWLRSLFPPAVTEPIRLHVAAKRYLCATHGHYLIKLSPASQHSLELQGGIFTPQQAQEFINLPYAKEAIKLRFWDEQAKIPDLITPNLETFLSRVGSSTHHQP